MLTLSEHTRSLTARFTSAAKSYHEHADAQRHVAKALLAFLPDDVTPSPILELGCGSGQLTEHLVQRFPKAEIVAVDISGAMLEAARERIKAPVLWLCKDITLFDSTKRFPLIVSSSSLHWCEPLEKVLKKIHHLQTRDGVLVASLMVNGTLSELRSLRNIIAPEKSIGKMPASETVLGYLEKAGYEVEVSHEEPITLQYPSADDFFRSLHAQGLTGGKLARAKQNLSRDELRRLTERYQSIYGLANGRVTATYHPLYFRARPKK